MKMKSLDSSEIVGLIGKAAYTFLKSLALLAASPAAMSRVEAFDGVLFFRCASIFWIQISLPKIILRILLKQNTALLSHVCQSQA